MERKKVLYFCVRCLRPVDRPTEHRKLRSQGGSDSKENVQPMCDKCHRWKHQNPEKAYQEGYYIRGSEPERDWRKDFPHGELIVGSRRV